jgi:hypothetical protein
MKIKLHLPRQFEGKVEAKDNTLVIEPHFAFATQAKTIAFVEVVDDSGQKIVHSQLVVSGRDGKLVVKPDKKVSSAFDGGLPEVKMEAPNAV